MPQVTHAAGLQAGRWKRREEEEEDGCEIPLGTAAEDRAAGATGAKHNASSRRRQTSMAPRPCQYR